MAKCLVTGAAGFVGSHLCERLIRNAHDVVGLDNFSDYYARSQKEANLAGMIGESRFSLVEADLLAGGLSRHLADVEYVFHLAAQPGVRSSWGTSFETYLRDNVLATQALLEACKERPLRRLVYASSSSIYGDAESFPTAETALPQPVSPYGVTKLAGEQLVQLYRKQYGIPTGTVRYFTIYGPRQRPDMAFHRFIRAILSNQPIELYGDGEQTRDVTFVSDAVEGTIRAAFGVAVGHVFNLGGGSRVSMNQVIDTLFSLAGREVAVNRTAAGKGDARHTGADTRRARDLLEFRPQVDLGTGLQAELDWLREALGR